MTRMRTASALLFAGGVVLCTLSDIDMPLAMTPIDGHYVFAADFHVHAAPGDGGLAPWDARREARRRGLDVIAITNHNHILAARLHRRLFADTALPLVLVGQEVTAPYHHILAIGISRVIDWRGSAAATIDAIHAAGGVAIAAHPGVESARDFDPQAFARLDAAERAHPGIEDPDSDAEFAAFLTRAREHNPRVSAVGNTDFHFTGQIGDYRTYVIARELTAAAVLDALRNGQTVVYDRNGQPFGDRALIRVVEQARRARGSASPPAWAVRTNAAGAVMAWIGLAGLVLLGPGVTRSDRRHG